MLHQLVALDKAYSDGATKINLAWLAQNMEAGRLGVDTSTTEELTRFTKITANEDDTTGPNSTLFRFMQADAGGETTTNLANKVKSVLANKDAADTFRPFGAVRTELETPDGHFVDARAILTAPAPLTVRDLDASGNLVTRDITIPAGTPVAIETKAYATDTWTGPRIVVTQEEVGNGYRFVDPGGSGQGESLVAVTPDILDDEPAIVALLQAIRSQPGIYGDRSAVFLLPRKSMGTGSYNDVARGLIRSLLR